ncbi:MAG: choice-of-anchor J domain-containing protein [Pedobacter sp.]|nr:choice-of-anchor J domain-containing protein [Pedobacter sp.]
MKTNVFKGVFFTAMTVMLFGSCTKDTDYQTQPLKEMIYSDDFSFIADNPNSLTDRGWTLFPEAGTLNWSEDIYSGDSYAVFTTYGATTPETVNIAWLISPAFNLDNHDGEKLLFQAAQAYVSSSANSLEVLISSDFDGNPANVLASTWTNLAFNQPTLTYASNFDYVTSQVDLSSYTGNVHIAFKVKGSGTNNTLDGTYQIDNIRVIY